MLHLKIFGLLLLLGTVCLSAGEAAGTPSPNPDEPIYRYVTRDGVSVFTNDPSHIPKEYRSSAEIVPLPPAVVLPPPPAPEPAERPSVRERAAVWFSGLPPGTALTFGVVLPVGLLSAWGLWYLRSRTEGIFARVVLRLGIAAVLLATGYLCYFLFLRVQTEKIFGRTPAGADLRTVPNHLLDPIKDQEENRLQRIEEIADAPSGRDSPR